MNQSPVNQSPVNQLPVNQLPVNQSPVNQSPVNQLPVNQSPVNQSGPRPGLPVARRCAGATWRHCARDDPASSRRRLERPPHRDVARRDTAAERDPAAGVQPQPASATAAAGCDQPAAVCRYRLLAQPVRLVAGDDPRARPAAPLRHPGRRLVRSSSAGLRSTARARFRPAPRCSRLLSRARR